MSDQRTLRVGILADSEWVSKYVFDLVTWSKAQTGVSITHLILHPPRSEPAPSLLSKVLKVVSSGKVYASVSKLLFRCLVAIERSRLRRMPKYRDHGSRHNVRELISDVLVLRPQISASGLSFRFDEVDIQAVQGLKLDVLLRCGGGILRGDILLSARFGVISFHHADNRINRGTPAGFWEVYNRQPTTGFTLQRLGEELDGGDVLMRGQFPTRHFYLLNQAALFEKSNYYLKLALERLAESHQAPPSIPPVPYSEKLFRVPQALQSVAYLGRSIGSTLAKKARKLSGKQAQWQVSFLHSEWRSAVLWRATPIPNPPGRYLADPFLLTRNGKNYCFVEDYDCSSHRGRISVYEIGARSAHLLGVAIDEPFHLSFPFLFEHEGTLYMCPESSENKDIRIYRCNDFPTGWTLEKTAMTGVSAVDTMFFERKGKWWMCTNIDPSNTGEHCSELYFFSSDSPLSSNWTPHAGNPVLVDASKARNGGLLRDGHQLFRVSQRQGFDRYGEGSQINEIVELSETKYQETCIATIEPAFRDGLLGTHHFHSVGELTVFDSLAEGSVG